VNRPDHSEIAAVWQQAKQVLALFDEQLRKMSADSYVATHQTGTVEATVNGHLRLTGLTIDPRILGLGAQEVAGRINETIGTAIDYAIECVKDDATELEARVADAIDDLLDSPPST
jgi:DNA-binding protein YbaB